MNFRDAMAATVQGDWVRHDAMQPGSYIAHSFADGPRINFPSGSSSGWTAGDSDREAEWTVCGPEVERRYVAALHVQQFGRALRPVDPAVGWGNRLPPVCANCQGLLGDLAPGRDPEEFCDTCYEDSQAARAAKLDNVGKWGKPVERDKWGRLTNAPD